MILGLVRQRPKNVCSAWEKTRKTPQKTCKKNAKTRKKKRKKTQILKSRCFR